MKKPQYYTYAKYSFGECLINALTSMLVVTLFIISDLKVLTNISSVWTIDGKQTFLIFATAFGLIICNEFFVVRMKKGQNLVRLGIEFALFIFMGLYVWRKWEVVSESFVAIANNAYDIHFYRGAGVTLGDYSIAITLLLLFLVVLSLLISFITKHLGGTTVLIIAGQVLSLAVNVAPQKNSILIAAVGVLLCSSGGVAQQDISMKKNYRSSTAKAKELFHRVMIRIACALSAFLIMGVTTLLFGEVADRLIDRKAEVIEYQKNAIDKIASGQGPLKKIDFSKVFNGSGGFGSIGKTASDKFNNKLTNDKPVYLEKTMMKVTCDKEPTDTVYLRKGYARKYVDGEWTSSNSDSGDRLEEKMYENYVRVFGDANKRVFEFEYPDKLDISHDYHPYMSNYSSENESGPMHAVNYGSMNFRTLNWIEVESLEESDWTKYNETVQENYLLNSAVLDQSIRPFLDEVRATADYEMAMGIYGDANAKTINEYRYYASMAVQSALSKYAYSLYLDKLPEGKDPVEYFLETSHTGYCMHYASAAVIALRELGVPCRYVYGYVAPMERFSSNNGKYVANVKDSYAHAWVDVYLDNLGWVPLEVTSGYVADSQVTPEESQTQKPSESDKPSEESQSEKPSEPTEKPNSQSSQQKPTDSEAQMHTQETQSATTTGDGTSEVEKKPMPLAIKVILGILAGLLVIMGILFGIYKHFEKDKKQLSREVKRKLYSMATRHMNRNLYKRLKYSGKIKNSNLNDAEYEELLAATYTDISEEEWKRFMDIVKKATFSCEEILEEEMAFVRAIYTHKPRAKHKK